MKSDSGKVPVARLALAIILVATASGCTTPAGIVAARQNFYLGNFDRAYLCLSNLPPDEVNNKVLMYMERGTINQARGDYRAAAGDWQKAVALARQLDYYSISQGGASLVVNDNTMSFFGAPYERTLLHTFNAENYLALALWDEAAVDARNIAKRLKDLNGFPDDPFSRYVAAFSFEMAGDHDGARLQYRKASELLGNSLKIDEETGRFISDGTAAVPRDRQQEEPDANQAELVCFIFSGRIPAQHQNYNPDLIWAADPYSEIHVDGKFLGRSYALANTGKLMVDTERRLAAMKIAKEVARIAVKEAISEAVSRQNTLLGELVRILLFSMEAPDLRRWETLPLTLQVARVPCPKNLREFKVVFRNQPGTIQQEKTVVAPITRRGNVYFSFCRDIY